MKLQFLSASNGLPLAKSCDTNGVWSSAPRALLFNHFAAEVATAAELLDVLQAAGEAGACFVQGVVKAGQQGIRRLAHSTIERGLLAPATIASRPLEIIAFDVDKLDLPTELHGQVLDHAAVGRFAAGFLGAGFEVAEMVVQFTAKHGLNSDIACLRLWFVLAEPTTPEACKALCRVANERSGSSSFDPAIFSQAQIHFLAAPIFENPDHDPCQGVARFALVLALGDDKPRASVPVHQPAVRKLPDTQRLQHPEHTPSLSEWANGLIPDVGFHQSLLRQALAAAKMGFDTGSTVNRLQNALTVGLPKSGLSESRQDEIQRRCVAGNEIQKAVDWASVALQAEAVPLKGVWARDLAAGAHAADPWLYAVALARRYEARAPKRIGCFALAARIARACGLDTGDQAALAQLVQLLVAERRARSAVLASRLAVEAARLLRNRLQQALAASSEVNHALTNHPPALGELLELNEANLTYQVADNLQAASLVCDANADSICVVIAPMGLGKTEVLLKGQVNAAKHSVVVNHRRSLVADSCKRLGLKDYRDNDFNASRLGICVDSLPKYFSRFGNLDLLAIDEFTQVIAACCLPGPMKKQSVVQDQLLSLIKTSGKVILTEASVSPEALVFLSRAMKKIVVIEILSAEKELTATILSDANSGNNALIQVRRLLESGERVLLATDSSELIKSVDALCVELAIPASGFACVHSDSVGQHTELLKDINANVGSLRLLAYSPAIQSGVSLTTPHFTRHLGVYNGVIAPSDFFQMLRRDRTASSFELILCNEVNNGLETDMLALHQQWLRACNEEALKQRLSGVFSNADIDRAAHQAALNEQLNSAGNNLVFLLEASGWTVDYEDFIAEDEEKVAAKETTAARKERELQAILAAPALFGQDWRELERKQEAGRLRGDEVATYQHGIIRRWLCLDSEKALDVGPLMPLTAERLNFYDRGRVIPRVRSLELVLGDGVHLRIESARDKHKIMADKINPFARHDLYRELLGAEMVELLETGTGAWRLKAAHAENLWLAVAGEPAVFRGFGIEVPNTKPQRLTGWAKSMLEGLGVVFGEKERVMTNGVQGYEFPVDLEATMAQVEAARRRMSFALTTEDSGISSDDYWRMIEQSNLPAEYKAMKLAKRASEKAAKGGRAELRK